MKRSRAGLALALLLTATALAAAGCPRGGTAVPAPVEIEWPDAAVFAAADAGPR